MNLPVYKSNDELPPVMHAKDVAGYLHISLTCAYEVMHSKNFPVIHIGKRLLVTKEHFLQWLHTSSGQIL